MFSGRQDIDSDNTDNSNEQPDPGTKRGKKRRRDGNTSSHNATTNPTSSESTSFDIHQNNVARIQSSHEIWNSGVHSHLAVSSASVSPNPMFDPRFYRSSMETQRQLLDLSLGNSLMQAMPNVNPNLDLRSMWTTMHLRGLEQQRIMELQNAELLAPARASALIDSQTHLLQASLSNNYSGEQFDPHLAQFGLHRNEQGSLSPEAQLSISKQMHASMVGIPPTRPMESDNNTAKPSACPDQINVEDGVVGQTLTRDGVTLYVAKDRNNLNENQVFLRQQLEAFQATSDDLCSRVHGKTKTIELHRVGIRCRHCSHLPLARRNKASTYFPSNLMAIYQAAQNISVEHLQSGQCPALPLDTKDRFSRFAPRKLLSSGGGKKYWADAARKLGLVDTDDGIRFATDIDNAAAAAECDTPSSSCKPRGRAKEAR